MSIINEIDGDPDVPSFIHFARLIIPEYTRMLLSRRMF